MHPQYNFSFEKEAEKSYTGMGDRIVVI
jgi:hypothetical protein